MKPKAENVETARVVGYLGKDRVLYCSLTCAAERGQNEASPVDEAEYQVLMDRDSIAPGAVCPVCGSDFPLDWPGEE